MELKDSFGRKFDYLRISLTDRCNLRCFYCMPEKGIKLFKKKEILTLEEIEYLVFLFYKNFNIRKIRFTGGEPLLRRGFEKLIENIKKHFPEIDLNITTNGILLKEKAEFLKEKNFKVNLSLDTLKKEKFKGITGFDYLGKIIEGIYYALDLKIPLKINTVVLKNINDDEIIDLIDFAGKRDIPIRFIEYMPLSGNGEWKKYFVSEEEIKKKIKERYELVPFNKEKIAKIYKAYPKPSPVSDINSLLEKRNEGELKGYPITHHPHLNPPPSMGRKLEMNFFLKFTPTLIFPHQWGGNYPVISPPSVGWFDKLLFISPPLVGGDKGEGVLRALTSWRSEIGFISTISNPFCSSCSRLRITSDGKIVLCLFDRNGYDIKKFLRPSKEKELVNFIKNIVKLKPEGYIKFKREEISPEKSYIMRKIGG